MSVNSDIEALLKLRSVAVVGCSPKPERASHQVASYLIEAGYRVFPVNPGHRTLLGERCWSSLSEIDETVDLVNVFRKAEFIPALIDEAIAIRAKGVWLQDGLDHPEAVAKARENGLVVVVNDCVMRQHLSRFR
jgi:predicted CoA-binding protein